MSQADRPRQAAVLAGTLADDEIHVWQLAYRPQARREPLRALLASYLGIDVDQVVLRENEHGRPSLAPEHASSLDFNWSHSGDHALIAVGRGLSLGIDLERLSSRPRALEIARRYFSAEETAALQALSPDARGTAFLELWTAKESLLKALGRGIAFGLHRLHIALDEQPVLRRFEGEQVGDWQLRRLAVGPGLVAALAWRGASRKIQLQTLPSSTDRVAGASPTLSSPPDIARFTERSKP
jgi:4'-phosphopantetheinyl transferase